MKFLQEVLRGVQRLDPEDGGQPSSADPEFSLDDPEADPELDPPQDELSLDDPELGDDQNAEHPELDDIADKASENPDRQGLIRTIKGAHLVYKRDTEDGTYEELWIYNVTTLKSELDVKKAILAGTDIPTNKIRSPDGSQTYEIWSAGNAEMILIKGLPN